jgi:hypothetical protein
MRRSALPHAALRLAGALAAAALPAGAAAQPAAPRPAGWRVAVDAGGADSALAFETMRPGWHLTAGPAAVVYEPSGGSAGRFTVESEVVLFSAAPGTGAGIALGVAPAARLPDHTAFVVGPDGRFRVTRRDAVGDRPLVAWTAHPAVARHPGGRATVRERLAVRVAPDSVRFDVNGQQVAALPRAAVQPEGAVGLRVEPATNVHVATLVLDGRNLAPASAPSAGTPR